MTSRDDLREAIKAGKLADALVMAMSNAVELNITTWITSEDNNSELAKQKKPERSLRSQINLVEGKIKNEVGEQFVDSNTHKELKRFHLEQVLQGNKTIRDNIVSLQKLFQLLQAIQKHQGDKALSQEALLDLFSSTVSSEAEINLVSPGATTLEVESEEPEVDDDWDDSVLDIFESLPNQEASDDIPFSPNSETELVIEASGSDLLMPTPEMPTTDLEIEDWEEAKVEFQSVESEWEDETTEESVLSLDDLDVTPEEEEDWGDLLEEEESTSAQRLVGLEEEVEVELEPEFVVKQERDAISPQVIQEVIEEEEEEDWGDYLVTETSDNLESVAEAREDNSSEIETIEAESATVIQEVIEEEEEEDWGDYLVAETPDNLEIVAEVREDNSSEIETIEAESATVIQEAIEGEEEEDWGDYLVVETPGDSEIVTQVQEDNSSEEEDFFVTEAKANVFESESLTEDDDEDWGDWLEEETDSIPEEFVEITPSGVTTYQAPIVPNLDSLDLEDDDDWEKEEQTIDTFAVSYDEATLLDSDFEEDWDEFSIEELEPYSNLNIEESKEQQMPSETVKGDLNQDKEDKTNDK